MRSYVSPFFLFNDTPTTEIYTLSLHDALPISPIADKTGGAVEISAYDILNKRVKERLAEQDQELQKGYADRKSTRLNSSHVSISYAVFCLKKKKRAKVAGIERAWQVVRPPATG